MIERFFFSSEVADGASSPPAAGRLITAQMKLKSDIIIAILIGITEIHLIFSSPRSARSDKSDRSDKFD